MSSLAAQRCLHHDDREAVCRCPGCHDYFCRECVSEHGGRLLCAVCLARLSHAQIAVVAPQKWLTLVWTALGLIFLWLCFYMAGWAVVRYRESLPLPEAIHLKGNG